MGGVAENRSRRAQIPCIDVLPFHQMGRFKWEELKLNYTLNDVQSPGIEAIEEACEQFRAEGLKAF
jgi:pyruvate formate lyase activating enzyme